MKLLYEETLDGISVRRCYGLDGIVQIPDRIDGKPVTGLEGYLFSETVRGRGMNMRASRNFAAARLRSWCCPGMQNG